MTREPAGDSPQVYRIDGRKIKSANDFYREIGAAVNGAGGYFGRNLDALADCLRGGFGTPEKRPYAFEWQDSALSRRRLGAVVFESIRNVFDDADISLRLE